MPTVVSNVLFYQKILLMSFYLAPYIPNKYFVCKSICKFVYIFHLHLQLSTSFVHINNLYNLQHVATHFFQVFLISFSQIVLYTKEIPISTKVVLIQPKKVFLKVSYCQAMLFFIYALYQRYIYCGILYLASYKRRL